MLKVIHGLVSIFLDFEYELTIDNCKNIVNVLQITRVGYREKYDMVNASFRKFDGLIQDD